jgi:hypothetical protein
MAPDELSPEGGPTQPDVIDDDEVDDDVEGEVAGNEASDLCTGEVGAGEWHAVPQGRCRGPLI